MRALGLGLAVSLALPASSAAFDPALETLNFAKTSERMQYVTLTPEFQARLTEANVANLAETAEITATDPERVFQANVCAQRGQECAGDVRFYDWPEATGGLREPVLFTARNGATLSGNVWATRQGPPKRPAVVITTGSVQAPETLYWGTAAVLAKSGYVVLTYDVQGQGRSDTLGEGPDAQEGVPSQAGQPFYDGTEDALDFLLSTAADPYDPRPSCGNANNGVATDHSAKQDRRVAEGRNAAYNPLADLVDPGRVGIAGHSLGAAAVSYVGQIDPRVDAIAAWDNLRAPGASQAPGSGPGGPPDCPSDSSPRPKADIPITKPALGISNDYGIAPTPNTADPDPQSSNGGFIAYRDAGVDSMQINIRGGTHEESAFIPGMTIPVLGLATLRGSDMVAFYTTSWFDRTVKCAPGSRCAADAERRLLTDRWRDDERGGQVDPGGDPNLYSFYKRSRYELTSADGTEVSCDDMRSGCASMGPDGLPGGYDHVADAYTLPGASGSGGEACALAKVGEKGDDTPATLVPSAVGDSIRGRGGDDRLRGRAGADCLYGERGKDRLKGDADDDKLVGGPSADRLSGGAGRDRLTGGPGPDRIVARDGERDVLRCGAGRDQIRADRRDRLGRGC